ncbi:MAG: response regulator [Acidobacteriota bacterium]
MTTPTRKILVIDDEQDVRDLLRTVLTKSGYDVVTADNGTDGLIRAHVERPDLILLDIMMEKMDGWETLRLLQLDDNSARTPVVIISARVEPRDKIRALQEGAVDYFTKPFSLREDLEKIDLILADTTTMPIVGPSTVEG